MRQVATISLLALAGLALAKEMAPDLSKQASYRSGAVMQKILETKEVILLAMSIAMHALTSTGYSQQAAQRWSIQFHAISTGQRLRSMY